MCSLSPNSHQAVSSMPHAQSQLHSSSISAFPANLASLQQTASSIQHSEIMNQYLSHQNSEALSTSQTIFQNQSSFGHQNQQQTADHHQPQQNHQSKIFFLDFILKLKLSDNYRFFIQQKKLFSSLISIHFYILIQVNSSLGSHPSFLVMQTGTLKDNHF